MNKFISQYKYHLVIFLFFLILAGISGYYTYKPDKLVKMQDNVSLSQTQNNIPPVETPYTISSSDNIKTKDDPTKTQNIASPVLSPQNGIPTTSATIPATMIVDNEKYSITIPENTTVYEMMQNLSASSIKPFFFSGQDYGGDMGFFVTEINGIKNDNLTGKYWIYYINGENAQIGISYYLIQPNDIISWHYEKSTF